MTKKILIIDDSPSVLAVLDDMLQDLGYATATAGNGRDALALIEQTKFNLIITDLTMPVMDGKAFVEQAKKLPNCKFVPIVMLSSEDDDEKIAAAKKVGISTFIRKPVREQQLKTILSIVLGG